MSIRVRAAPANTIAGNVVILQTSCVSQQAMLPVQGDHIRVQHLLRILSAVSSAAPEADHAGQSLFSHSSLSNTHLQTALLVLSMTHSNSNIVVQECVHPQSG